MRYWIVLLLVSTAGASERSVTWTGWFADAKCHGAQPTGGKVGVPNPDCARTCIEKGAAPVFLSEQANGVFAIKEYGGVLNDLGYHVEVLGEVDEAAKTIRIREVKQLEPAGPACARPRKK
jgi:hypothetical protein